MTTKPSDKPFVPPPYGTRYIEEKRRSYNMSIGVVEEEDQEAFDNMSNEDKAAYKKHMAILNEKRVEQGAGPVPVATTAEEKRHQQAMRPSNITSVVAQLAILLILAIGVWKIGIAVVSIAVVAIGLAAFLGMNR